MKSENKKIVIAGGGVIGTAIAYELSKHKELSVTLLDIKKPGNATQASAGGLWAIGESVGLGCGVIFFKTLSKLKQEVNGGEVETPRPHHLPPFFFDFCLQSNDLFPQLHEELIDVAGIDFKLQKTGLNFIIYDQADQDYAQSIYDAIPHLQDQIQWLDQCQLRSEEPYVTPIALGALKFLKDDQVNPYLLMQAFSKGAMVQGVNIVRDEVVKVIKDNGRVVSVHTREGQYPCDELINAGGAWGAEIADMVGVSIPIEPVKGQILLTEKLPFAMKACWSTSDCYIAQKDNGEVLIGSTTEKKGFETINSISHLKALGLGALKAIPILKDYHVKRSWSGLRPGTPDEIPILGRVKNLEGYVNACGHFRTGILTSAITAKMITSLILEKEHPIDMKPFLLERFDNIQ